jgi:hypothetical protein
MHPKKFNVRYKNSLISENVKIKRESVMIEKKESNQFARKFILRWRQKISPDWKFCPKRQQILSWIHRGYFSVIKRRIDSQFPNYFSLFSIYCEIWANVHKVGGKRTPTKTSLAQKLLPFLEIVKYFRPNSIQSFFLSQLSIFFWVFTNSISSEWFLFF